MNIKQARNNARVRIVIGMGVAVLASLSTLISLLLMLSAFTSTMAAPLRNLVYVVYANTGFLGWLWQYCPTPTPYQLITFDNLVFALIYLAFFVGLALSASGWKIQRRVKRLEQEIDDQLMRESIQGVTQRSREQIERSAQVPGSSVLAQIHQLYIAPLVVTIVGGLILKFIFGV
ncbi:YniB family protein [Pseudomonas borbori]